MEKIFGIKKYADELNVAELMAVKGGAASMEGDCKSGSIGTAKCSGSPAVVVQKPKPTKPIKYID